MAEMERVTASSSDGVETIVGEGELTLYFAEQFKQALADAVATGNEIVVDLRKATFIDTAIVAALIQPAKKMLERGTRLKALVTDDGYPQYVLRIVGFADLMDIVAEANGAKQGR
jgi:anti-anti-sigma factor